MDTWIFFKWIFKTFVAVFIVTHTFDLVVAVFDVAQHIVQGSAGVIGGNANIDISSVTANLETTLQAMEIPELLGLCVESLLIGLTMKAMSLCIFIIVYGRMLEIYLMCAVVLFDDVGRETACVSGCSWAHTPALSQQWR